MAAMTPPEMQQAIEALQAENAELKHRVDILDFWRSRVVDWLWRFGHDDTMGKADSLSWYARAYALEESPSLAWPMEDASSPKSANPGPEAAPATPAQYEPKTVEAPSSYVAGHFGDTPKGTILHSSRSGVSGNPVHNEFTGTSNYCTSNPDGLAWNATIGDDEIAVHLPYDAWGWNARAASPHYLAVEFAQPTRDDAITDGQVRAFVWFFKQARNRWSSLPSFLPSHAEVEKSGETGRVDGKDDAFPFKDARMDDLRSRIYAEMDRQGVAR